MGRDRVHSTGSQMMVDMTVTDLFNQGNPEEIFDIIEEIGHGSFGSVFKGRDRRSGEIVAIKKMTVARGRHSEEEWQEIMKEILFMKSCDHENICKYKGCYCKGNTVWLAMEFCVGSASDIVEVFKTPLTEEEISAIISEVLKALDYLHNSKKIHRDIKGNNVLLTEDGEVRLGDFGSASMNDPANTFIGTPYWMAPEVIMAMETGTYMCKVDIWSLGITCIELADKRPPLYDIHAMSALYHIPQNEPPRLTTEGWSDKFKNFIALCLHKDPSKRPSTTELLQHPFITLDKSPNCLPDLVQRSQKIVCELDSRHFIDLQTMLSIDDESIEADCKRGDLLSSPDLPRKKMSSNGALVKDTSTDDIAINFGTIRPRSSLAGEKVNEHDLLRQQLKELTRLKKKHQQQLDLLQKQHELEQLEAKNNNQKDLDLLIKQQEIDYEKFRIKQRAEFEAILKAEAQEEKKELKALRDFHANEFKNYQESQISDLKEKHKQLLEATPKQERKSLNKPSLDEGQAELNAKIREEQQLTLEKKMKKFKSSLLEKRHNYELEQLQDELNFLKQQRTAQWEVKKLLQQGLRDMRLQQLRKVHETQEGQQSTHQKMEIDNLEDSHKKSEKELRRKQYLEAKQRPKEYKAIEVSLKKKYDELCRAKRKSFKEKQKKLTETTPREELEECLRRLKKDQMIHLQELAQEYSKNLNEMLENATSQFDFRHQEENTSLIAKHNEALKSLKQFQNQRKDRSKLRHMAEVDELKRLLLLKQEEFNRQFQEDIDRCVKDSETKIAEAKERQRLEIEDHLAHYKIPE